MLSGAEIRRQILSPDLNNIYISNFDELRLNPNSYNLTLSNKLLVYTIDKPPKSHESVKTKYLDSKEKNETCEIIIPKNGLILLPNKLYLGSTNEYTETKGFVPCLSGRSSGGRLGINIHATAGFGDNGFCGKWTLEIFVIHPVKVYPDQEICQIYYESIEGDQSIVYNGKYQGQSEPIASKLYLD